MILILNIVVCAAAMTALFPCVTFGQIAEVQDAGEMSKLFSKIYPISLVKEVC